MIEQLINRFITTRGAELELDEDKMAIANYGLQIIVYSVIGFVIMFIVAWLLGIIAAAFAAFITGALLRTFSGGAHCKSPFKCLSMTCTIYPLLGLLALNIYPYVAAYSFYITGVIFVYATYSLYKLGPVDCEEKPVTCPLHKRQLRFISFSLIAVFLILSIVFKQGYYGLVLAAQLGILWQSLTLWPTAIKLAQKYDRLWNKELKETKVEA